MKDYIIETITGQKRERTRVKAMSLDTLRARLIKEGVLSKEEMVVVFTTNAKEIRPDTPFNKTGVIWLDNYNKQYFWMDNDGKTRNVTASTGKLFPFKVGVS